MKKDIWYLEDFDFHQILCPYKLEDHVQKNPNSVLKKHEFLFMEEDLCQDIILIDRGKVKVGHYTEKGEEHVLAFLGTGEILGHMALLGETRHRAFAEVMEEGTQVCKMSVERARQLTRDYVPFALEMNRRIGNHIRKLERRIEILMRKNIKDRMVEFLHDLGQEYGEQVGDQLVITHNLTQSDIAALIGTSRKSASLMLNELQHKGYIRFDRKTITLLRTEEMKELVTHKEEVA